MICVESIADLESGVGSQPFENRQAGTRWGASGAQGDDMMSRPDQSSNEGGGNETRTHARRLTAREVEVLEFAACGLSARQIANQLFLSEHTVLGYMKSIFAKLGAHSKVQAVVLAIGEGIIEVPDIRISSDGPLLGGEHRSDSGDQDGHLPID